MHDFVSIEDVLTEHFHSLKNIAVSIILRLDVLLAFRMLDILLLKKEALIMKSFNL